MLHTHTLMHGGVKVLDLNQLFPSLLPHKKTVFTQASSLSTQKDALLLHTILSTTSSSLSHAPITTHLSGHNFCIGPGDLDSGIQASTVVGLHHLATKDSVCTNSTIIWPLGSGESILWPPIWIVIHRVEEGVFLLHPEPRLVILDLLHGLDARVAVVGS